MLRPDEHAAATALAITTTLAFRYRSSRVLPVLGAPGTGLTRSPLARVLVAPVRMAVRMVVRIVVLVVVLMAVIVGPSRPAAATWSIVAVEPGTGRVGAVMASCVPSGVLGDSDRTLVPIVLVPGSGAAVAQGTINPESPVGLRQLLTDGATPREAIDALLEIDDQPTARQFGVVSIDSLTEASAAAFTGEDVQPDRGDRTVSGSSTAEGGQAVPIAASVQGVLLADQAVLDESLAALNRSFAAERTFEQALVDGLVAGSEAGGDRRCGEQTALFAHLAVADPGDDPTRPSILLTVTVDEGDGQNPVPELARALDDGRTGWIDIGLDDPLGIPRLAVVAFGVLLAVAAFVVIRKGMGSPAARR